MWTPDDLVSDQDLVAYESRILTQFAKTDWQDRRQKAIEDWLFPALAGAGFDPYALRTRYTPDQVWGYTASAYTDLTTDAGDRAASGADDLDLDAVFTTPGSDFLYVGSTQPFRGLSLRMSASAVNTETASLRAWQWTDQWVELAITDGTALTPGVSLAKGGSLVWRPIAGWPPSTVNSSDYLYFVRVGVSAALTTGTSLAQLGVIRRSRLCGAVTMRTLELIMREAPTGQAGPWDAKADYYGTQADQMLNQALRLIGGEFDTVTEDDQIDATEAAQTAAEAGGGSFKVSRG